MPSSSHISDNSTALEKIKVSKRSQAATETALQIERFYSQRILAGKFPPGYRLPPNNELTQIWSTSNATVQRALSKLTSEGLIERQQGRGTFVRDKAEQALIGVFVGPNLATDIVGFYRSLVSQFRDLLETEYVSVRVYDGLTKTLANDANAESAKESPSDRNADQSLRSFILDSKYHTFNGYIYLATSNYKSSSALTNSKPKVTLHDELRGDDVILDSKAFLEESIVRLLALGATNIAYVQAYWKTAPVSADFLIPSVIKATAKRLRVPKFQFWDFPLVHFNEMEADDVLRSGYLDKKFSDGLPDAVIISDDIIARPLIFNFVRRGLKIPEDLLVCVRSNDAQRLYYGEPVYRYELPIREISHSLVNLLHTRMAHQPEPPLPIMIKGHFKEPFSSNY